MKTTEIVYETINPEWINQKFAFIVRSKKSNVVFNVWDWDKQGKDFLGRAFFNLFELTQQEEAVLNQEFKMQKRTKKSHVSGSLNVNFEWYSATSKSQLDQLYAQTLANISSEADDDPSSNEYDNYDPMVVPNEDVKGTITLTVKSAKDIKGKRKMNFSLPTTTSPESGLTTMMMMSHEDPYVEVIFEGQTFTTSVKYNTRSPEWNETFKMEVRSVVGKILVKLWDFSEKNQPYLCGYFFVDLSSFATLKKGNMDKEFLVKTPKSKQSRGKIMISIEWLHSSVITKPQIEIPDPQLTKLFSAENVISREVEHQILYKVIVLGDSGVGKTQFFNRWLKGSVEEETKATVNISFDTKAYNCDGKVVRVQLWDTAGQERYRAVARQYYRGSHGVVLMYSIVERDSFEHLHSWLKELQDFITEETQIILIGNQCDRNLERTVSTEEGLLLAKENKLAFLETCAIDGNNCSKAMQWLLQDVHKAQQTRVKIQSEIELKDKVNNSSSSSSSNAQLPTKSQTITLESRNDNSSAGSNTTNNNNNNEGENCAC
eukprot:TRINITY_DN388_c0_g1_i2.p1 TRINITY_DN388_c0_g1~~TRINITY_DN388_c0_g1_i2.p1  ORF type:complete len:545 (+),score=111.53 TRINITY_DN388_c0_g1_i2:264-1898(+)